MRRESTAVRRKVRFGLLIEGVAPSEAGRPMLSVTLSWRAEDPYAVTVTFPRQEQRVRWVLGRCLLAAGLEGPAGLGDVSVLPDLECSGQVELILSSPDGRIGFLVEIGVLEEFLRATWAVVPAGEESRWLRFEPRRCGAEGDGGGSGVAA